MAGVVQNSTEPQSRCRFFCSFTFTLTNPRPRGRTGTGADDNLIVLCRKYVLSFCDWLCCVVQHHLVGILDFVLLCCGNSDLFLFVYRLQQIQKKESEGRSMWTVGPLDASVNH